MSQLPVTPHHSFSVKYTGLHQTRDILAAVTVDVGPTERTTVPFVVKAYITIAIRLRYDYDEKLTCSFFCLRRIGSRRARYVVVGS